MSGDEFAVDADRAERMLNGEPVGPAGLVHLLASLRPTAHRADAPLAGEERALAMFRSARAEYGPAPAHHRRTERRPAWARLVTVKIVVIALGVVAGGVAVAASVGVLPSPFTPEATSHIPGQPSSSGSTTGAVAPATGTTPTATTTARPDVLGLCHAFLAEADLDKATHNPRFADLVQLAGGLEHVRRFCLDAIASPEPGDGHGHSPTDHPSHTPEPHPTGKPSTAGSRS
jgi:hypothetical protein